MNAPLELTGDQIRQTYPLFYGNPIISKVLAHQSRWTISGVIGEIDESPERYAKQRKAPIDLRCLLRENRIRGAWAKDEQCLVTLDELTERLPYAANTAYYLRMNIDGVLMVDIEPDCPSEIASVLLKMPGILYSETSMSGKGYHLLMRKPTNMQAWPEAAAKTVLRHKKGWYELLLEHWATFTRNPIPADRIAQAHAAPVLEDTPSTLEELFADLAVHAATSGPASSIVHTQIERPEIPYADQIVEGMLVSADNRFKEPADFNHDLSQWEFSVLGRLNYWLNTHITRHAGTTTHVYTDADRAWLLYEAATYVLPPRPKHSEMRNHRPYLLDQAASMIAKSQTDHRS